MEQVLTLRQDSGLGHERLLNLIIFVLMDTMLHAFEEYQKNNDEEDLKFHDALLVMKGDSRHINVIYDWVVSHQQYISDANYVLSDKYYRVILDGILIEYNFAFKNKDVDEYATACEQEYLKWI